MDLPKVIAVNKFSNGVRVSLYIDSELDVFKGHFDDIAIVAGVVQIGWAIEFCCQYLQKLAIQDVECMEALKFLHIITPGLELDLNLEIKNNKLIFSFLSIQEKYSSGKIVLI